MWVQSLGRKDPLEKAMATHSSILAWEFHEQNSLVGYMRSMGLQELDMAEYTHGECSNGAFRSLFRNKGHVFLSSGTVAS